MSAWIESINSAADSWRNIMWGTVWQSTALFVVLFLLARLCRRAPAKALFWLWLLVPLRLLVMPFVTLDLPVLPAAEPTAVSADVHTPRAALRASPEAAAPAAATPEATRHRDITPRRRTSGERPSQWTWVMAAWLLGVTVCVVRLAAGYWRLKRMLRRSAADSTSGIIPAVRRAAQALGLRQAPRVLVAQEGASPFVFGLLRPVVVLPASLVAKMSTLELEAVLAHELAHLRRRDILTGWVLAICNALYFFHPILHLAKRRLLYERERACDECVLALADAEASAYARAIVSAAQSCRRGHALPAVAPAESFRDLKERLLWIAANPRPATRLSRLVLVALSAATLTALPGVVLTAQSAPARPTASVTFKGVVTNVKGEPVADVRVYSDVTVYGIGEATREKAETRTDGQGRFELGPLPQIDATESERLLTFDHPSYGLAWLEPGYSKRDDHQALRVMLVAPMVVEGSVKDRAGAPVHRAIVTASIQPHHIKPKAYSGYFSMAEHNGCAATTDAEGRFILRRVPEGGRLHLYVEHEAFTDFSTRDNGEPPWFPVHAGQRELTITLAPLDPGGAVEGQLVLDGEPLRRGDVSVSASCIERPASRQTARTDEQGRFVMARLKAGSYLLTARVGSQGVPDLVGVPKRDVMVQAGVAATSVELELTEGRIVQGRITSSSTGEAVNNVPVSCQHTDSQARLGTVATDQAGRYRLRVPPGQLLLTVPGWQNGRPHPFTKALEVPSGPAPITVDMAITVRPQVRGRLVDAAGAPAQGRVRLGSATADTDVNGTFSVPAPRVHGGTRPSANGWAFDSTKARARLFSWKPEDQGRELRIVVEPMAVVTGQIVDDTGAAVADADVRMLVTPNVYALRKFEGHVDDTGLVTLLAVPVGLPMKLLVRKDGHRSAGARIRALNPGETRDLGKIVLRARESLRKAGKLDAVIAGRVVDENNRPVAGAGVSVASGETRQKVDTHWGTGKFRLTKLPSNHRVSLCVYYPSYGFSSFRDVATGQEDLELQIFPDGYERLGKPAPELLVEDKWFNSEPLTLASLRGQVVVLQLCYRPEFGTSFVDGLNRAAKYFEGKDVVFICVRIPRKATYPRVADEAFEEFLQKNGITIPFAVDRPASHAPPDIPRGRSAYRGATSTVYYAKSAPSTSVIDKKGILRQPVRAGGSLRRLVGKLLAE